MFFLFCQDLHPFVTIRSLGLPNCNIMLQQGRTRRRTSARVQLTTTLEKFPHLVRLDLSHNSFSGCLREVLDALSCPLQFLSLRDCDLLDQDLVDLTESKHAASLRQLDLSKICGLFPDDNFAISTSTLVRALKKFPSMTTINLQQNQITNARIEELCQTMRNHWPKIKGLNLQDNIIEPDSVLKVVRCVCAIPSFQVLKIPYAHNMLNAEMLMETARMEFVRTVDEILTGCGRTSIEVEVQGMAYAVFGNM